MAMDTPRRKLEGYLRSAFSANVMRETPVLRGKRYRPTTFRRIYTLIRILFEPKRSQN